MNLRESIDNPEHGEPMPNPLEGREDFLYAVAFAAGYGEAKGLRLGVSTPGGTMRLHNLTADTRSAPIRRGLPTTLAVLTALRAQFDAMPYWEPEDVEWGPDPWHAGQPVTRES